MIKSSKQHLNDSEETYIGHFKFAVLSAFKLLYASIASLIHAVIPGLFKGTAAYVVIQLYKNRLENHPNPLYKEWISKENDNKRDN